MTDNGQGQIRGGYALAVILDPDPFHPASLNDHFDLSSLGIQSVFNQLLNHGNRALHHFAGGDLIGGLYIKDVDFSGQK
ncbi:hypothetical protein HMPREF0322_02076 [Desulfitobacterium hafniense DP7]|uniref:Uncharacterized protein n=1 Tax=Desulfitobacterium hafniense DP7 TaxID=537010 RepID=G9XM90_DESHA|nr:hypothetical protein HMPREF0322_02076 [Desulfitobacterium hafniense DP7]